MPTFSDLSVLFYLLNDIALIINRLYILSIDIFISSCMPLFGRAHSAG